MHEAIRFNIAGHGFRRYIYSLIWLSIILALWLMSVRDENIKFHSTVNPNPNYLHKYVTLI